METSGAYYRCLASQIVGLKLKRTRRGGKVYGGIGRQWAPEDVIEDRLHLLILKELVEEETPACGPALLQSSQKVKLSTALF